MIFKNVNYRNKIKALWVLALLFFALTWFFVFGKTVSRYGKYKSLVERDATGAVGLVGLPSTQKRMELQEHILQAYSADSARWAGDFMTAVSAALSTVDVHLYFEDKSNAAAKVTIEKEIVLRGSFNQLQAALQRLEKHFFIQALNVEVENNELRYVLSLAVIKKEAL